MKFPNDIESGIYQQLGLPKIEHNIVEGVVIRPVMPCFLNNGARVMLKNKNEKWAEKARHRKREIVQKNLPEQVKRMQELILDYVTENRLNNVISKIGEITINDMGKVLGLFAADVFEGFMKDHNEVMNKLEKKEQKEVSSVSKKTSFF